MDKWKMAAKNTLNTYINVDILDIFTSWEKGI